MAKAKVSRRYNNVKAPVKAPAKAPPKAPAKTPPKVPVVVKPVEPPKKPVTPVTPVKPVDPPKKPDSPSIPATSPVAPKNDSAFSAPGPDTGKGSKDVGKGGGSSKYTDDLSLKYGESGGGHWGLPSGQPFGQGWGNYDWGNFIPNDFGFSWSDVPDYMRSLMKTPKALVMMMRKKGLLGKDKKRKKKKKKLLRAPIKK